MKKSKISIALARLLITLDRRDEDQAHLDRVNALNEKVQDLVSNRMRGNVSFSLFPPSPNQYHFDRPTQLFRAHDFRRRVVIVGPQG